MKNEENLKVEIKEIKNAQMYYISINEKINSDQFNVDVLNTLIQIAKDPIKNGPLSMWINENMSEFKKSISHVDEKGEIFGQLLRVLRKND